MADMKFEIVVIPVSDVDSAKRFYDGLGWRLDTDFAEGDDFRVIQFTPPGSGLLGHLRQERLPRLPPDPPRDCTLSVSDIKAAREERYGRGVAVSEVFHPADGKYAGADEPYLFGRLRVGVKDLREPRLSLVRLVQRSGRQRLALFKKFTSRLPGRVDADTTFTSATELASALRRAADAHGEHKKQNGGQHDENWPDWYAEYMVREQYGKELPL